MPLLNPWIILAVVIALAGATAGGAKLGRDHEIAKQKKTEDLIALVKEEAQQGAAAAIAKNRPLHTTIQQRAETILRENTVYTSCVNEPELERLLNAARKDGRATGPAGDSVMPTGPGPSITP